MFAPIMTNSRSVAANVFDSLQVQAFSASFFARVIGQKGDLANLADEHLPPTLNPKYLGLHDISVAEITGSVGRIQDFDDQFRPLYKHLRDRWVNAYLQLDSSDWPSIQVYKVGDRYYVLDGHHRVSVARHSQVKYILAEVWEYPCLSVELQACKAETPFRCPAFNSQSYAHS